MGIRRKMAVKSKLYKAEMGVIAHGGRGGIAQKDDTVGVIYQFAGCLINPFVLALDAGIQSRNSASENFFLNGKSCVVNINILMRMIKRPACQLLGDLDLEILVAGEAQHPVEADDRSFALDAGILGQLRNGVLDDIRRILHNISRDSLLAGRHGAVYFFDMYQGCLS